MKDTSYTIEEMLQYAIEDEYLAQAQYQVIMDTLDVQRPFSNIIKAEGTHISLLEPLLEEYDITVPTNDWSSYAVAPATLTEALEAGVQAEEINIQMYESFLEEDLPANVQIVFEYLQAASEHHLAAFQRSLTNTTSSSGTTNQQNRMNKGQRFASNNVDCTGLNNNQANSRQNGRGNGQSNTSTTPGL